MQYCVFRNYTYSIRGKNETKNSTYAYYGGDHHYRPTISNTDSLSIPGMHLVFVNGLLLVLLKFGFLKWEFDQEYFVNIGFLQLSGSLFMQDNNLWLDECWILKCDMLQKLIWLLLRKNKNEVLNLFNP